MKCPYCTKSLVDIKAYHEHHQLMHCLKPFTCVCSRKYPVWQSFFKHLKKCATVIDRKTKDVCKCTNAAVNCICNEPLPVPDCNSFSESVSNNLSSKPSASDLHESIPSDPLFALRKDIDFFVSKLYSRPKLPRGYVQSIIEDLSTFCQDGLLGHLKTSLLSNLKLDNEQHATLDNIFCSFQNPFAHLDTEYRRLKYFRNIGEYIPPDPYKIGELDINEGSNLVKKDVFGQSIPLDLVFKQFLEVPNALNDILSYVKSLSTTDMQENFVQSELWKKKCEQFSPDDIVLPINVFYDDCECNNPLGSHTDKLGCTYVQLGCLPPECQSKLDYIFLALVFKSQYRCFGDDRVFAPLIESLKKLEEGIIIKTPEGFKKVHFLCGLLLGDNLGVNAVAGLVECFTANYYCRFCKTRKTDTYTQSVEDIRSMRTKENYLEDLAIDNPSLTGVKTNCVLNDVSTFHITSNFCVDIFHDLCEGVCHYTMMHILKHCIPKYFSLDLLNHRIDMFKFGLCDSNKIPFLSADFAKRDKLKMSGSETLLFVKLFGILVGDKVSHDDDFWRLYLKLCELLDICLSKSLSFSQGQSLRVLVEEFNSMYVRITGDFLKPKMHFMVHYASVFEKSGPLVLSSTKRFEGKHRALLIPAHATESRRDICKTVSIQHQLNMSFWLKSRPSILQMTEFGPISEVYADEFENTEFIKSLPDSIKLSATSSCASSSWVEFKGSKFKPGMILILSIDQSGGPVFVKLEDILLADDLPVFVFSYMLCLGFDEHVHAYAVQCTNRWSSVSPHDLYDPLPLSLYSSTWGEKYVTLRYIL